MTIKTLTYIHTLMKEEKEKRQAAHQFIRDCYNKALDEHKPNASYLCNQMDKAWIEYLKASSALEDFEAQDF